MIKEYKPSRTYKKYDYQTHHSSFNHNTYLQNNYINPIKHSINKQSQSHS